MTTRSRVLLFAAIAALLALVLVSLLRSRKPERPEPMPMPVGGEHVQPGNVGGAAPANPSHN